jgi:hypothetical protein
MFRRLPDNGLVARRRCHGWRPFGPAAGPGLPAPRQWHRPVSHNFDAGTLIPTRKHGNPVQIVEALGVEGRFSACAEGAQETGDAPNRSNPTRLYKHAVSEAPRGELRREERCPKLI